MTTLTQSIANRQKTEADKRVDTWRDYRALLARRAAPDDGDLDALAELQQRLGKSDSDVRADIVLLDTEARWNRNLDEIQVLVKDSLAAQGKREVYREKMEALQREQASELLQLERECSNLSGQIERLRDGRPKAELRKLHGEHRELFGIEPPSPKPIQPPPRRITREEERIDEVRRRQERFEASGCIGPNQQPVSCDVPPTSTYVKPKARDRSADNAA